MGSSQSVRVNSAKKLQGKPKIPGDKSISHRGLIFGALALGQTEVTDILESEDVQSTQRCLEQMGVTIKKSENKTLVTGLGYLGLKAPHQILDCGNSGTTMRLLMGVVAAHEFSSEMTGDSSLTKRPMKRVSEPLEKMGARFSLRDGNFAPLKVVGGKLTGIDYQLKVASAQIKSAILLAGLQAEGITTLSGEIHSRDHTERMLKYFGAQIDESNQKISIQGGQKLEAKPVRVPGDPSTAAFWIAAACMIPGSKVEMENICLNPSRIGFINALKRMGAAIKIEITSQEPEPVGTISVTYSKLKGVTITEKEVPSLIDELPMLAVLATQAAGETTVHGAEELRVKETDRIEAVAENMRAMKVHIETHDDGFTVKGGQHFTGAAVESFHDHRIAMAFSIAGLIATGETVVNGAESVSISYPGFYKTLRELTS
jgi:3-phosphoshikimate 1-carboxyvinyltransferase